MPSDFIGDDRVISIMIGVNKSMYLDGFKKSSNYCNTEKLINKILDFISIYEYSFDV